MITDEVEYEKASNATRRIAERIAILFGKAEEISAIEEGGDSNWPEWCFGFTDTDGHTYAVTVTSTDEHS